MPTVAIVGASANPERYSHMALLAYRAQGWTVWPVHPAGKPIEGLTCYPNLKELPGSPEIVCLYVNPTLGRELLPAISALKPRLLWLNPGADDEQLIREAEALGLKVVAACTLVALRLGGDLLARYTP